MTLGKIVSSLGLEVLTPELSVNGGAEVTRGHASDLLSDVLANAPSGGVLLTIQVHMNVIAVALHAGLAAVVFTQGMRPEERRAAEGRAGGPAPPGHGRIHLRPGGPAVRAGAEGKG